MKNPTGWISPEGEWHQTPEAHFYWIGSLAFPDEWAEEGEEDQQDSYVQHEFANRAYSHNWISVGHAGGINVVGKRSILDDPRSPQVQTLREIFKDSPAETIEVEKTGIGDDKWKIFDLGKFLKTGRWVKQRVMAAYDPSQRIYYHYSNFPDVKINPKDLHSDPAGIYLFPKNFKTHDFWGKMKYRFSVEVPKDLKVLDIEKDLSPEKAEELLTKAGIKFDPKNLEEDPRRMWYLMRDSAKFISSPGAWNKLLRDAGYDAVFDDTGIIHSLENQLLVLDPTKIKILKREDLTQTGFQEVKATVNHYVKFLAPYGAVTVEEAKKERAVGEKRDMVKATIRVKDDKNHRATWLIYERRFDAKESVPHEITIHLNHSSKRFEMSMGTNVPFNGGNLDFSKADKEVKEIMDQIWNHVTSSTKDDLKEKYGEKKVNTYLYYPVTINGEDDYHLTVKFLGVNSATKEEILEAMEGIDKTPPQEFTWEPVTFDSKNDGKVKVLELKDFPDNLEDLHDALADFREDEYDSYRPHITVDEDLWDKIERDSIQPGKALVQVGPLSLDVRGEKYYLTKDKHTQASGWTSWVSEPPYTHQPWELPAQNTGGPFMGAPGDTFIKQEDVFDVRLNKDGANASVTAKKFEDEGHVGDHWGSQASGIMFLSDGKVLLLKRAYWTMDPGLWGIAGGAVPVDQTGQPMDVKQSAINEVTEEMGGLPPHTDTGKSVVFQSPDGFKYTTFVFEVPETFDPILNDEHEKAQWFPLTELPEDIHPGVSWAVKKLKLVTAATEEKLTLAEKFMWAVQDYNYTPLTETREALTKLPDVRVYRGIRQGLKKNKYTHTGWQMWTTDKKVAESFVKNQAEFFNKETYLLEMVYAGQAVDMDKVYKKIKSQKPEQWSEDSFVRSEIATALKTYGDELQSYILPPGEYDVKEKINKNHLIVGETMEESFLPEDLVMIDGEFTNVNPKRDHLLQVAMLKLKLKDGQYEEVDEPLVLYMDYKGKPDRPFHHEHLAHIFERCNESNLQPGEAKEQICKWLGDLKGKVQPVGDCVHKDMAFLIEKGLVDDSDISIEGDPIPGTFHYENFEMHPLKALARHKHGSKREVAGIDKENEHDGLVDCRNQLLELNDTIRVLVPKTLAPERLTHEDPAMPVNSEVKPQVSGQSYPKISWVQDVMNQFGFDFEIVDAFITGSVAKGTATEKSDLDIVMLIPRGEEDISAINDDLVNVTGGEIAWAGKMVDFQVEFEDDKKWENWDRIPLKASVGGGVKNLTTQKYLPPGNYLTESAKKELPEPLRPAIRDDRSMRDATELQLRSFEGKAMRCDDFQAFQELLSDILVKLELTEDYRKSVAGVLNQFRERKGYVAL